MSYQKYINEALKSYKSNQQAQNIDYTSPASGRFEGMSPIQVGGAGGIPFNPNVNMPPTSPYLSALLEYLQSGGQSFGTVRQPADWQQPFQGYNRSDIWQRPFQGYSRSDNWTAPIMRGGRY